MLSFPITMFSSSGDSWASWNGSQDGSNQATGATNPVTDPFVLRMSDTKIATFYGIGTDLYCQVGTVSGTTIAFGTAINIAGTPNPQESITAVLMDTDSILVAWDTTGNGIRAAAISVSGTVPTWGSFVSVQSSGEAASSGGLAPVSTTTAFCTYRKTSGADTYGVILSVSGTTVTVNTEAIVVSGTNTDAVCSCYDTNKVLLFYRGTSSHPTAKIVNISGTSIGTLGTAVEIESVTCADYLFSVSAFGASSAIVFYGVQATSVKSCTLSLSGNTVTVNTPTLIENSSPQSLWGVSLNSTEAMVVYILNSSGSTQRARVLSINGASLTVGNEVSVLTSSVSNEPNICRVSSNLVALAGAVGTTVIGKILKRA